MKAAINFADTGHLCLTTLHAVNSNQAMDRIMNMFPIDMREQLLMDLSLNLKAVISQRLVPGMEGKLACAVEIMMNTPYISELLREGNFNEIKEIMEKGDTTGMQTFDQSLYDLVQVGRNHDQECAGLRRFEHQPRMEDQLRRRSNQGYPPQPQSSRAIWKNYRLPSEEQ